ncbi:MAG: hypothetical protein JXR77_07945, partial [Lentisphaeria bacterium]|nr:hypothetical protein [Lentisphaeria bacterium]
HKGRTAKVPLAPLDPGHVEVMTGVLDYALDGKRLLHLAKKPEQDVEAVVRTNDGGDVILFLINWDNAPAAFSLTLDLPAPAYRVEETVLDGKKKSALCGRTISPADVKDVAMNLDPQEAKVLRFVKDRQTK